MATNRITPDEAERNRATNPAEMTASDLLPNLVQFNGNPTCAICSNPKAPRLLEILDTDDAPDIPALAAMYKVSVKDLLLHIYDHCAANPFLSRTAVSQAASGFAENVVNALSRTITRSEAILNELHDTEVYDEATGETHYPHRSINLAMAYNQIARTHAATLDGIVAASERKKLAQRLQNLEQTQNSNSNIVDITANQTNFENSTQTGSVLKPAAPRRSVAQLLRLAQAAPAVDPLS
jgi:hypothetical protein